MGKEESVKRMTKAKADSYHSQIYMKVSNFQTTHARGSEIQTKIYRKFDVCPNTKLSHYFCCLFESLPGEIIS